MPLTQARHPCWHATHASLNRTPFLKLFLPLENAEISQTLAWWPVIFTSSPGLGVLYFMLHFLPVYLAFLASTLDQYFSLCDDGEFLFSKGFKN